MNEPLLDLFNEYVDLFLEGVYAKIHTNFQIIKNVVFVFFAVEKWLLPHQRPSRWMHLSE